MFPLAYAQRDVYKLISLDPLTSVSRCFYVRPKCLLHYRDPSIVVTLTYHDPIIRSNYPDNLDPSVAALVYQKGAVDWGSLIVCHKSAMEDVLYELENTFVYNVTSGFVKQFVLKKKGVNEKFFVEGGEYCVNLVDPNAITVGALISVETSNGLTDIGIAVIFNCLAQIFAFAGSARTVKLA